MSPASAPHLALASLAMLPVGAATFAVMIYLSATTALGLMFGMAGVLVVFLAGTVLAVTSLVRKERFPALGAAALSVNLVPVLLMLGGFNR